MAFQNILGQPAGGTVREIAPGQFQITSGPLAGMAAFPINHVPTPPPPPPKQADPPRNWTTSRGC